MKIFQHYCGSVIEISDDERQPCEVWTRVMGYHRPVESFNTGKKAEHAERRHFDEEAARNTSCWSLSDDVGSL